MSSSSDGGAKPVLDIERLASLLALCPEVTRLNTPGEDEAWALAHHLTDLEEAFRVMLDDLFVKLGSPEADAAARYEVLLDIGEELRHVMYHIREARFFKYLEGSEG